MSSMYKTVKVVSTVDFIGSAGHIYLADFVAYVERRPYINHIKFLSVLSVKTSVKHNAIEIDSKKHLMLYNKAFSVICKLLHSNYGNYAINVVN